MPKSKTPAHFHWDSINQLVDYFETQDMGKVWAELPEVNFDVDLKRRKYLVKIDDALMNELTEVAKAKKTSPLALINSWIKERLFILRKPKDSSTTTKLKSSFVKPSERMEFFIIIYKDSGNNYRWRLCSPSNRVIADSAVGFHTKSACRREIDSLRKQFLKAGIVDQTA